VGAGKTTLLRLLSGMYKPQEGRVLLDDIDLSQISKPVLADNMGFVQQDGRLFSGTLRENLTLGMLDPGDTALLDAARSTGLLQTVITPHPNGLMHEISEGGTGLSGGQRQLVNLTRAFLRRPKIWLLDEPTASMDRALEQKIVQAFKERLGDEDTLFLVTHKHEMLPLVDRIIVVANKKIVADGPRDTILERLKNQSTQSQTKTQNSNVVVGAKSVGGAHE
jgi:ATP-binding cassette subfamily C protein LapB